MTVFDTLEGGRDKKNSAALNAFLLTVARKILNIKVLQNFAFFPQPHFPQPQLMVFYHFYVLDVCFAHYTVDIQNLE